MTGTIVPRVGGAARNDPELRFRDYREAFQFYLDVPNKYIDEIIFLENSGVDLSAFMSLARARKSTKLISLLSTDPNYPTERGKGYGEFLMLDSALATFYGKRDNKKFWKVTGRLIVPNIALMVESAPINYDIYCDMRDVPGIGDLLGGNKWMDLRLFSFTLEGYRRYLQGRFDRGYVLEKEFFRLLMEQWSRGEIDLIPRFNRQPVYKGFGAQLNSDYGGVGYRSKTLLRTLTRKLIPFLWI
jgi:hypothetical protein